MDCMVGGGAEWTRQQDLYSNIAFRILTHALGFHSATNANKFLMERKIAGNLQIVVFAAASASNNIRGT
jgi:hypothetical protein